MVTTADGRRQTADNGLGLKAPPEYWLLTDAEREAIGNGCGPKGAGFLVPDTIWGLSIREA